MMVVVSPSFFDEKKKDLRLIMEEGDEKLNDEVTEEVVAEAGVTEEIFTNDKEEETLRRRLNFGTEVRSI